MSRPATTIDQRLKEWATPRQAEYIDGVNSMGSLRKAEKHFKVRINVIQKAVKAVKKKAAMHGYAPEADMVRSVPEPFVVKGTSTYYNKEGAVAGQWVKTQLDQDRVKVLIEAFVESAVEEVRGLSPQVEAPARSDTDLMCVYPFGDPHFGMYAWAAEAGEDFDLTIAERDTCRAIDRLVETAPKAGTAILLLLGDTFHADDQRNQTPGHGHQLDVDSRYPKVLMAGIRAFRYAILRALERHEKVIVRSEPGNHDPHAKWALTLALSAFFENNPRVEIDLSPAWQWYYQFGEVLIGSTHGDKIKQEQLPIIMAADKPAEWGATKFRYWYTGHIHHQVVKEFPGAICESFRTLAPKDAYAAMHGYRAGRDLFCIVHHRDYGEIERHRCDIRMLDSCDRQSDKNTKTDGKVS